MKKELEEMLQTAEENLATLREISDDTDKQYKELDSLRKLSKDWFKDAKDAQGKKPSD